MSPAGDLPRTLLVRGTGAIGQRHLDVAHLVPDLHPVAWPVRPARLAVLQAAGTTVTDDQPQRPTGPAAAIIATDTGRHLADALPLLAAGWDLLIEKPLTPDLPTALVLAQAASESGRQVFVACPLRFHTGLLAFRERLPAIGRLHAVRIECQSFLPEWRPHRDYRQSYAARADEGGVLRDLIHEIDYALWLFGPTDRVFAHLQDGTRLGIDSDSGADLLWQTAGDVAISVRLDYLSRGYRRVMRAFGAEGELCWDAGAGTVQLALAGKAVHTHTVTQERNGMFQDQLTAFLAATAGIPSDQLVTIDEGIRAIAVCDAARRATVSGRSEPIREGNPS